MKEEQKELLKGLGVFFIFFYIATIIVLILYIFGIELDGTNYKTLVIFDFVVSLFMVILVTFIYRDLIKEDIKKLKNPNSDLRSRFFEIVVFSFFLFMVWKLVGGTIEEIIFNILGLEFVTSDNQEMIELLTDSAPILMAISVTFFAPITEEIIFRGMLGRVIKNKKVFIPVSGLIFGLMHVTGSTILPLEIFAIGIVLDRIHRSNKEQKEKKLLSVISVVLILLIGSILFYVSGGNLIDQIMNYEITELLNSITYVIMGLYLAYIYCKHDNILVPISVHALNNGMSAIMMLFMF